MENKKNLKRGYFTLTKKYLYIANDGNPFDRQGVIAICNSHLSSKTDNIYDDNEKVDNRNWINAFNKSVLKLYKSDKNRLIRNKNIEKIAVKGYWDRWHLELLQNIDDAIGPKNEGKYIGTKGLGFFSILEIAEGPSIFSGPYNFEFSKEKVQKFLHSLKTYTKDEIEKNAPTFDIPWPCTPDKTVKKLLQDGYATVIKLKVKDDYYDNIDKVLKKLDTSFLLFSQNLNSIKIEIDQYVKEITKYESILHKNNNFEKTKLQIKTQILQEKPKYKDWIRWKRSWASSLENEKQSSCMFCLPFKNNICIPYKKETNIFNFYPTDECSNVKGFLHISFDVSQDRKRLYIWGDEKVPWDSENLHPENNRLIDEIQEMVINDVIADDLVPAETTVKTFLGLNKYSHLNIDDTEAEPLKEIQRVLINKIRNCKFIPIFGDGLSSPDENLLLWKDDLLSFFDESIWFREENLISQELRSCFDDMEHYGSKYIDFGEILKLFADYDVKNKSISERKKIIEFIGNKSKESDGYYVHINEFLNIHVFEDEEGQIVSLDEHYFISNDQIVVPSFINTKKLHKRSRINLENFLLTEDNNLYLKSIIRNQIIDTNDKFINIIFHEVILENNRNKVFWEINGYETLAFIYSFYLNNKKIFLNKIEFLKEHILLPKIKSSEWRLIRKSFFSKSWLNHSNLSNWLNEYAENDDFEIIGYDKFEKKLSNFQLFFKNNNYKKNDIFSKIKIKIFLESLGVNSTPIMRQRSWNYSGHYETIQEEQPTNRVKVEWQFRGLNKFFENLSQKDVFQSVSIMAEITKEKPAKYTYPRGRTTYPPLHYYSFANYQLCTSKWIKIRTSPLNPDGFASPDECYINKKPNPIFPCISEEKINSFLSEEDTEILIRNLKIKKSFLPVFSSWSSWEKWIKTIPLGYKTLIQGGADVNTLNAQVVEFYRVFFQLQKPNFYLKSSEFIPTINSNNNIKEFSFSHPDNVLWNNTTVDDFDLSTALKELNLSLFILGKYETLEEQHCTFLGLKSANEVLKITPNYKKIDNKTRKEILDFFQQRWPIFSALDNNFLNRKRGINYEEFFRKLILCENLSLNIASKLDSKVSITIEASTYDEPNYDLFDDKKVSDNIYIVFDEDRNKRTLIAYICNVLFGWKARSSLVNALIYSSSESEIAEILKFNSLDPGLISHFKLLFEAIEDKRRKLGINKEKRKETQVEFDNQVIPLKIEKPQEIKKEKTEKEIKNNSLKKIEVKDKRPSIKKDKKSGIKKGKGSNIPKTYKSGYAYTKPKLENTYDDEDENFPNRKAQGARAEKFVFELLKKENALEDKEITLRGGNFPGYDIEYKKNGKIYFVEVKSLEGGWEGKHLGLSITQFIKSLEQREKYFLYIVEYVDIDDKRNIININNPAKKMTKLFLDPGWKDYSEGLKPQSGRYLNDKKGNSRLKIKEVKTRGVIIEIILENGSKVFFDKENMNIEEA